MATAGQLRPKTPPSNPMVEQLPLDLGRRPAQGREVFMISQSNAVALATLDSSATWPGGKLALVGPEGAGKTHLAHVWAQDSGATVTAAEAAEMPLEADALVIEDVDRIVGDTAREERVFHLHNAVLNRGGRLLVTGRTPPGRWAFALSDLDSRLRAAGVAQIDPPDEALLAAVLVKLFADRQVRASAALVSYLVKRIERSFAAAEAAVARLDEAALARDCAVSRHLAVDIFGGSATVS